MSRSPGFTIASIACLGIGIGITTSVYSSIRAVVLAEIPDVSEPGELVRFQRPVPYSDWGAFREGEGPFGSLAGFAGPNPFVVGSAGREPERVWGQVATPNYFSVLGARAEAGRLFGADEERGGASSAVISYRLWQRRFGGSPALIGQSIRVNSQPVTVIGVASRNFLGASPMLSASDIWIPTTAPEQLAPELAGLQTRLTPDFALIGRLKKGIAVAQAEAALEPRARRLEQLRNDPRRDREEKRVVLLAGGRIYPMRSEDLPKTLGLTFVLVGLVLLMSCGNVATMLVARGSARRREIAIRLALGAARGRIVRQLLTESTLLALGGCGAGLLVAKWETAAYQSFLASMPGYIHFQWSVDPGAILFATSISVVSGVVFGLAPALQATKTDLVSSLKSTIAPEAARRRWLNLRNVLVTEQVAASLTLLLLTGYIVFAVGKAGNSNMGFDSTNLYLLNVDPVRGGYDAARSSAYARRVKSTLETLPGVRSVAIAESLPSAFGGAESMVTGKVELMGGPAALGSIASNRVGENFFETAGIQLVRGRGFDNRDWKEAGLRAVVNQTLAGEVWPGQDALGHILEFEGSKYEVVGVARDVHPALPLTPSEAAVYLPVTERTIAAPRSEGITVLVRTQPGFDAAPRIRRELELLDSNVPAFHMRRMEDVVGETFYILRFATTIYGALGAFALALATFGLAGVTSYSVARRTSEIGIRMALGATTRSVFALVMKEAAAVVCIGAPLGFAAGWAMMRFLGSMMNAMAEANRISSSDPRLLVGAPALLAALALAACYIPARRAMSIDPAVALRME